VVAPDSVYPFASGAAGRGDEFQGHALDPTETQEDLQEVEEIDSDPSYAEEDRSRGKSRSAHHSAASSSLPSYLSSWVSAHHACDQRDRT
jgi:hypothetical protein